MKARKTDSIEPEVLAMLGLKRGTVRLLPHQKEWSGLFEAEKQLLTASFGKTVIGIEHIGSTAIPNIPAKPILDIAVAVESLAAGLAMKDELAALGYVYRPSTDESRELLYVKGSEEKRSHYLHLAVVGSEQWCEVLCFRDRLRNDAALAQEYADLKLSLAAAYPDERGKYTSSKALFIQKVLSGCKVE